MPIYEQNKYPLTMMFRCIFSLEYVTYPCHFSLPIISAHSSTIWCFFSDSSVSVYRLPNVQVYFMRYKGCIRKITSWCQERRLKGRVRESGLKAARSFSRITRLGLHKGLYLSLTSLGIKGRRLLLISFVQSLQPPSLLVDNSDAPIRVQIRRRHILCD